MSVLKIARLRRTPYLFLDSGRNFIQFATLWFAKTVESGGDLPSDFTSRNANYADQHKKPIGLSPNRLNFFAKTY